ncbi:MAG: uroporphyrinogen decarboxylase family protein [Verrucomicrobiota bacterium]|nr:uroporphyrinogen decarboxylase family protein [Verrucomicrobiota bacterium]
MTSILLDPEFLPLTTDLDVAAFWQENERCNEATENKPRCKLTLAPDDHWMFEFLAVDSTLRYYQDKPHRDALHKESNQITKQYMGQAFFNEDSWVESPRRIENLFGCEFAYHEGGTPWLVPVTDDPDVFAKILDKAESTDIAQWALPEPYLQELQMRMARGEKMPHMGTGSRGPATVMTSILAPETLFYWMMDHEELVIRFRDVLQRQMVALNKFLRQYSGCDWNGWWITDDNCALFSPGLYRDYCAPIVATLLETFASRAEAYRYQHSDSAMGHLLDQQQALGINNVNYGPEVDPALIRTRMPQAVIHGHMPPFLLRNGSPEAIRARVIEDFAKVGAGGRLIYTTAGSLAAGTGMGRVRWLMKCVQECTRY